jgi:hypothetical protein
MRRHIGSKVFRTAGVVMGAALAAGLALGQALAQGETPPPLSRAWAGEAPRVGPTCGAGDVRFAAAPMFRIVPGNVSGRVHFYAQKVPCRGGGLCPHQGARYLVADDVVFAGPADRGFRCVAYGTRDGELIGGFITIEHLVAVEPERTLDVEFLIGNWRRDADSRIRIAGAGLAGLRADGAGVWKGMNTLNEGEFRAEFQPGIDPAVTIRDGGCAVTLERRGPYLLANDNARCGGNNVRFVGIYIRRGAR